MNFSKAIARTEPGFNAQASRPWLGHVPLALLLLSLVVLYAPTAWSLAHSLWQDDTHSHGPLVLLAVVWLFWRGIRAHAQEATPQPSTAAGAGVLGLGLLIYVLGRSQGLYVLEVGSAIPVVLGGVLLTWGAPLARKLWFAFVFLLFLVPLPGSLIDTITHPMKLAVSWAAEHLMHAAGYPVARAGVVLGIGPYQLFVADACAGLNSLFMLEAFGLLYLNVVRHESALRNAVLAVLIVPISFVANVLRVVVLALVTFHFGDAAGQGFIHSFSGVVLFGVALVLTVGADVLVRSVVGGGKASDSDRMPTASASQLKKARASSPEAGQRFLCAICACGAVVAFLGATALTPSLQPGSEAPNLEALIPKQVGNWTQVPLPFVPVDVVAAEPGRTNLSNPYDQVVMRAYANPAGQVIALAVAYGANQRQEVKIHQPELCYGSQGFRLLQRRAIDIRAGGAGELTIPGTHLYAESSRGNEAVSYWIRIGDVLTQSAWSTRLHIFQEGLRGEASDGVLVRASSVVATSKDAATAFTAMDEFLSALITDASPALRRVLTR